MKSDIQIIHEIVRDVYSPPKRWSITRSRKRIICDPVQAAHWACYYYTKATIVDIAFHFGRKDHGNVLHSVKAINSLVKIDYDISCKILLIQDILTKQGFDVLFPEGRSVLDKQKYSIQTRFKQKPARIFEKTKPQEPEFISPYATLKELRKQITKTENIEDVVLLSKEIKRLEGLFCAKQHTK